MDFRKIRDELSMRIRKDHIGKLLKEKRLKIQIDLDLNENNRLPKQRSIAEILPRFEQLCVEVVRAYGGKTREEFICELERMQTYLVIDGEVPSQFVSAALQTGAMRVILEAIDGVGMMDSKLLATILALIVNFTSITSPNDINSLVGLGTIDSLIAVLRGDHNEDIITDVLSALGNLVFHNDTVRKMLISYEFPLIFKDMLHSKPGIASSDFVDNCIYLILQYLKAGDPLNYTGTHLLAKFPFNVIRHESRTSKNLSLEQSNFKTIYESLECLKAITRGLSKMDAEEFLIDFSSILNEFKDLIMISWTIETPDQYASKIIRSVYSIIENLLVAVDEIPIMEEQFVDKLIELDFINLACKIIKVARNDIQLCEEILAFMMNLAVTTNNRVEQFMKMGMFEIVFEEYLTTGIEDIRIYSVGFIRNCISSLEYRSLILFLDDQPNFPLFVLQPVHLNSSISVIRSSLEILLTLIKAEERFKKTEINKHINWSVIDQIINSPNASALIEKFQFSNNKEITDLVGQVLEHFDTVIEES